MVLDIKNAYPIILRPNPDVSKPILEDCVYFIATDITVCLHEIYWLVAACTKADSPRTTCRKPDIALAVFKDTAKVAEVSDAGIGEMNRGKLFGVPVE